MNEPETLANTSTRDQGVWPYLLPILSFLLLVEASAYVTGVSAAVMLVVRVAVPLIVLIYFAARGCYREIQIRFHWMIGGDVLVGIGLAAMWMAPYVLFPQLRPAGESVGMDPMMAGASGVWLVLAVRMLGFAIVTPWMEELFMRSFLMRFADVYDADPAAGDDTPPDFREVPIGRYSLRSFIVVVAVFLMTHQLWEAWVMLPWAVLTNLWFYYRKDLFAVIVLHAATNGAILMAAYFLSGYFMDADGTPISLWFFV
ncbi:CAAX amino terminal protease self- immunity [Rubripirellula lacrimiformis]|uniref:CAAX amino terminal protease self-immunity n=1 Tax=Rubripirellula lacrimiformis TaxID=1930273 RepID=A0A517NG22_9BACT|nr:CPBP family glutamic-type intramembrane protease [Rubripirellula lacrimiformis]QDT06089.1 CAAX amino terminal protease self- immunity [Rubripirellula lacrimiformis]